MDSVLIKLPDTLYEFLQAMAVVQDYQVQLAVGAQRQQRDGNYQITFRLNEKFEYFEKCLRVVHDNIPIFDYSGWDEEQRDEYNCFIRFDEDMFQRARKISGVMQQHITTGLNTLIGAGASPFPVLAPLQLKPPADICDVLILNWNSIESEKLYQFILNNYPDLELILDPRDFSEFKPAEIVEYINNFRCVIGPAGVCTYLAATMKKVVVEMFKTNEEGRMYGAAGTPRYWSLIGEHHTAEFVWTVWEDKLKPALDEDKLCPELMLEMSNLQGRTSKEIPGSTVVSAEEKSGDKPTPRSEA